MTVVVPCFNEAARLERARFVELARTVGRVIFVDDASTDGTPALLDQLVGEHPTLLHVEHLARNRGKGEAVRHGLLVALRSGDATVGYLDADLATPVSEYVRLVGILESDDSLDAVLGSRVSLAGHEIRRRRLRHYLGRVYATGAGLVLGRAIYDTQCGAKVFRAELLRHGVLEEPFVDRWSFDVELLGRIEAHGSRAIREVPLEKWTDVGGSKVGLVESVRATLSLAKVHRRLRHRRRRGHQPH